MYFLFATCTSFWTKILVIERWQKTDEEGENRFEKCEKYVPANGKKEDIFSGNCTTTFSVRRQYWLFNRWVCPYPIFILSLFVSLSAHRIRIFLPNERKIKLQQKMVSFSFLFRLFLIRYFFYVYIFGWNENIWSPKTEKNEKFYLLNTHRWTTQ